METLKTATGKEFQCDYFNPAPSVGQVNLRVLNAKLPVVASVFSDGSETMQLWCGGQYAAQYTKLIAIAPEGNAIRIVLGRE